MKSIVIAYKFGIPIETLLDDEDHEKLKDRIFSYESKGYPLIRVGPIYMELHRYLMQPVPKGMVVDHINRNKLDNRKENLRVCTNAQNLLNRASTKNRLYDLPKGVTYVKRTNRFQVQIKVDGLSVYVGVYKTALEAELAAEEAILKHHKQFACIEKGNT